MRPQCWEVIKTEENIEVCMKNLSARLLDELYERDCSTNALGRACGITGCEIRKLLDAESMGMRLSTLFKISKGLGMKPSAFLASIEGADKVGRTVENLDTLIDGGVEINRG